MNKDISERTKKIFSEGLINKIKTTKFCIVGCGAVGSTFAEMLIRSGAENIILIDGEKVEQTNLNRTTSFIQSDVDKYKVDVLEKKLKAIKSDITVQKSAFHLREFNSDESQQTKYTRDLVVQSKIVVNVPDTIRARITCSKLCDEVGGYGKKIKTLFIGVHIEKDFSEYYCHWNPKAVSDEHLDKEGYGDENGSYMAIVMEATSIGFMMLLHHLENLKSKEFINFYKKYENYKPMSSTNSNKPSSPSCPSKMNHKILELFHKR